MSRTSPVVGVIKLVVESLVLGPLTGQGLPKLSIPIPTLYWEFDIIMKILFCCCF